MADDEPRTGEIATPNYGWTLPTVGASDDAWGGYLNSDLLGIDGVVHGIDTRPGSVTISDTAPASPQVGQLWYDSVGGQLYTYYNDGNSSQWVSASNATTSLLPASTTVLGGVKVDGTTIKAAGDGTISTTVVPLGDNRIINGDMRIDARNNGSSGTAVNTYTIDRWQFSASQVSKGTWQRNASAAPGFPYYLGFGSGSAYASLAGDNFNFIQPIEADMVSDFQWGTANAQPATLSFWVYSSLSGTFGGAIRNAAGTRSYPFTYSLTASTWTKIVVAIPADAGGTWVMSGNAAALWVCFDLGCGSTYRGPAGAWASANYLGATGAVSIVAINGATFFLTGVKLEIGSVATPYNRQSLAKSMADCQRYYQAHGNAVVASGTGTTASMQILTPLLFPVTMRAAPTVTPTFTTQGNCSGGAVVQQGVNGLEIYSNATASAMVAMVGTFVASAEL